MWRCAQLSRPGSPLQASAHHASVNFGQYDFASLLFNVSSMVRRPIPRPPGKQSLEDRAAYQASTAQSAGGTMAPPRLCLLVTA